MNSQNPLILAKAGTQIHPLNSGPLVEAATCDLDPGLRRDER
jgi:hypothetical protein